MNALWINIFPKQIYAQPLARVWSRNFASFCYQIWTAENAVLAAHLTEMIKTYMQSEEQAWVVKGAHYEILNMWDAADFQGIVNKRFDPWSSIN